jgi:hypothetical protein
MECNPGNRSPYLESSISGISCYRSNLIKHKTIILTWQLDVQQSTMRVIILDKIKAMYIGVEHAAVTLSSCSPVAAVVLSNSTRHHNIMSSTKIQSSGEYK